jgi:hypothetical protein
MTQKEFLKITNFREAFKALQENLNLRESKQVTEYINKLAREQGNSFYNKDGIHVELTRK